MFTARQITVRLFFTSNIPKIGRIIIFSLVIAICYGILGGTVRIEEYFHVFGSGYFDNRYISAKRFETDQVMNVFALIVGEMYPVGLCLHILPDVSLCDKSRFLVGPRSVMLGSVRFLFERYQAGWISQQKVVESASSLNFYGDFRL